MTYINEVDITIKDTPSVDSFGRLRVSDPANRLDCEFLYGKQKEYFDEITRNGTVTFNSDSRDLTLSISATTSGDHATMASYPVPYTPGCAQLIDITGVLDFQNIGTGNAEYFLRSKLNGTINEEVVEQNNWDNLTSGVNWNYSHIFQFDFQSLRVGRIRLNLVKNGVAVPIGSIKNDNKRNTGFWQIANGSVFWKVYNDDTYTYMECGYGNDNNAIGIRYKVIKNATAKIKAICCTVKSEGGETLRDMPGLPHSINNGVTPKTISTTLIPVLSIRSKTTFQNLENLILSVVKNLEISTSQAIRLDVIYGCTLTGASWVDVDTDHSSVEYDISSTTSSGGTLIYSKYLNAGTGNTTQVGSSVLGKSVLWSRKGLETGILSIACIRTGGTNSAVMLALNWEDLR